MSSQGTLNFVKELNSSINSLVKVSLDYEDKWFIGILGGFDQNSLSLVLMQAKDESNNKYEKIFIRGNVWTTLTLQQPPFPIYELAERIKKVLPNEAVNVTVDNKIELLDGRIIVSENGVEGTSATAKRIEKIYEQFMADKAVK